MSGIGLVLNIAKDALLTQQYAIDVVSHNISNVSTDGYTRQTAILASRKAAPYGGFIFGRGVELYDIARNSNGFIEKRLQDGNSDLLTLSEKNVYMDVMETILNENSSRSLSSQLVDFWNAWNDLSNNPSGLAERNLLTENGELLAQTFNDIADDLDKLDNEIDNSIEAGVHTINELLSEIADLNKHVIIDEINGNANDLRDQRNVLVNELAQYIDINTYEYEDGNLTVTTGRGYILVSRSSSYPLEFDGSDIKWQSSANTEVNITETISGGKLGGWLDIRDEIIPKYSADLGEIAKSIIWEVNKLHSQGIGLNAFSSVTGSYASSESAEEMGTFDSGLDFYDKINDGSFKIWLYDSSGAVVGETTIAIQEAGTTMNDLATTIENITLGGEDALRSSVMDGKLHIEIDTTTHSGYTFAFSDDTSNILAALGINTFFNGSDSRDISMDDNIIDDKSHICAAIINNNTGPASAASGNSSTGIITTSGPYTGSDDSTYNIEITGAGDQTNATFRWNKDGGSWTDVDLAVSGTTVTLSDGVTVTFTAGNFVNGDTFTIDVTESSDTYGDFAPGDNSNALTVSNLQFEGITLKRWTYERGSNATSSEINNTTIDDYLHTLIGSIGIQAQSIEREREYKEVIFNQISQTRDNISAVSLDEEMANLIKHQQAYATAAKLITTAEEMLETLINSVR